VLDRRASVRLVTGFDDLGNGGLLTFEAPSQPLSIAWAARASQPRIPRSADCCVLRWSSTPSQNCSCTTCAALPSTDGGHDRGPARPDRNGLRLTVAVTYDEP
jgi:hypothetical protein